MQSDLHQLLVRVAGMCGLSLRASPADSKDIGSIKFRISGLDSPHGVALAPFQTAIGLGLKAEWDLFSADLISQADKNFHSHPEQVAALFERSREGVDFSISADGKDLAVHASVSGWKSLELLWFLSSESEPDEWLSLERLLLRAMPLLFDLLQDFDWSQENTKPGEAEGLRIEGKCGRYERSATNRAACLEHYGPTVLCQGCGANPVLTYGDGGAAIFHVHHLTPLSEMTAPAPVSPINDLVPLCPNCHNFAHKRKPPFSPDEIAKFIESANLRPES